MNATGIDPTRDDVCRALPSLLLVVEASKRFADFFDELRALVANFKSPLPPINAPPSEAGSPSSPVDQRLRDIERFLRESVAIGDAVERLLTSPAAQQCMAMVQRTGAREAGREPQWIEKFVAAVLVKAFEAEGDEKIEAAAAAALAIFLGIRAPFDANPEVADRIRTAWGNEVRAWRRRLHWARTSNLAVEAPWISHVIRVWVQVWREAPSG